MSASMTLLASRHRYVAEFGGTCSLAFGIRRLARHWASALVARCAKYEGTGTSPSDDIAGNAAMCIITGAGVAYTAGAGAMRDAAGTPSSQTDQRRGSSIFLGRRPDLQNPPKKMLSTMFQLSDPSGDCASRCASSASGAPGEFGVGAHVSAEDKWTN